MKVYKIIYKFVIYLKDYKNYNQIVDTYVTGDIIEFISEYLPSIKLDNSVYQNSKAITFSKDGMIKSACIYQKITKNHIHISYIATSNEFRRKSLSSKMIDFLKIRFKKITTFVRESNKDSLEFFKKNGFIEIDRIKLDHITGYSKLLKLD